ncbi:hypothetical protein ACFWFX_34735 [Streptomyces roseolus]|uniref:hypothetical protein n=1 Tax=Streptomyces roseolus TaxID=67358 RepID=UPI00364AFF4D
MNFDENEPPSVRDERFVAERVARRAARKAASLDSRGAHLGAVVVAVALVLLGWYGKLVALGIVSGVFLLWFAAALAWAYADGDGGRHAVQRGESGFLGAAAEQVGARQQWKDCVGPGRLVPCGGEFGGLVRVLRRKIVQLCGIRALVSGVTHGCARSGARVG